MLVEHNPFASQGNSGTSEKTSAFNHLAMAERRACFRQKSLPSVFWSAVFVVVRAALGWFHGFRLCRCWDDAVGVCRKNRAVIPIQSGTTGIRRVSAGTAARVSIPVVTQTTTIL